MVAGARSGRGHVAVLGPDLDPGERADRGDVFVDPGPGAQGGRQHEPALVIARELFGVGEQVADEGPVAGVLDRRRLEAGRELRPDRGRVEDQARVGLANRYKEARAQAFAEARGDDKTTFIVKAMFHRAGEQGPIRCQRVTPLGTIAIHWLPL